MRGDNLHFIGEKKRFYFCVGVLLNTTTSGTLSNFVTSVSIYKVNEKTLTCMNNKDDREW